MDNRNCRRVHGWQQAHPVAAVPGKGSAKDTATAGPDGTARPSNATAPVPSTDAGSGHPDTPAKTDRPSKDSLKVCSCSRRTATTRPDYPLLDRQERTENLLEHCATRKGREAVPIAATRQAYSVSALSFYSFHRFAGNSF